MLKQIPVLLVVAAAGAATLVRSAPATAQDWRTITTQRQLARETELDVEVQYGAGKLSIQPGAPGALYKAMLKYDAEMVRPVTEYHDGSLKIGIDDFRHVRGRHNSNMGRLEVALSPQVPLNLELKFGAVEADIELGGLYLRNAEISTGASQTRLRFSRPNLTRCDNLKFAVGAAEFKAYGLGNTNTETLEVNGGVGDIMLDFAGEWKSDLNANINMGLGSLTLQIPRGIGVRLQKNSMLASFDYDGGMSKRGNTYTSSNWDDAKRKLNINLDAALGSVHLEWVDGAEAKL
jgi:hypothetical protein